MDKILKMWEDMCCALEFMVTKIHVFMEDYHSFSIMQSDVYLIRLMMRENGNSLKIILLVFIDS